MKTTEEKAAVMWALYRRPDFVAARKAALADPAVRAKMNAARKAAWADPAVRAKMSAARKAALADPAVRAKMSAARKAAWADPAARAKISAARKAAAFTGQYADLFATLAKKVGKTAARRLVADQMRTDARRSGASP